MICFARIDDRLIHGQVAVTWVRSCGANRIYIVDDATASDPFMYSLLKKVAPQGTKVEIWSTEEACKKVKLVEEHQQIKGFILCKEPKPFLTMANANINFKEICVANMSPKEGRTQLHPPYNTYVTDEEKNILHELASKNIYVYIRHILEHPKTNIMSPIN